METMIFTGFPSEQAVECCRGGEEGKGSAHGRFFQFLIEAIT